MVRPPSTSATIRPSRDADVLDLAVDAVGGVVDFPAGDPKHKITTHLLLLLLTAHPDIATCRKWVKIHPMWVS